MSSDSDKDITPARGHKPEEEAKAAAPAGKDPARAEAPREDVGGDTLRMPHTAVSDEPEEDADRASISAVKTVLVAFAAAIVVFAGALGVYLLATAPEKKGVDAIDSAVSEGLSAEDIIKLNIFFPVPGKVSLETREIPKQEDTLALARAVLREYFRGPDDSEVTYVPDAVEVVNVYLGPAGTLYIDLPSAMSLNFKGDAVAEFLMLRAMYRTLKANLPETNSYRLLVDGQQVDNIGGHIYIAEGLEKAVAYKLLEEDSPAK